MRANTYDGQSGKFLATIATSLPSLPNEVMQRWINNPQQLASQLGRSLMPNGGIPSIQQFKTWIEIQVGTFSSPEELLAEFTATSKRLDWDTLVWSNEKKIREIPLASTKTTMELVRLTPRQCGFIFMPTYAEFFGYALSCGLQFSQAEVAIQLRLQRKNQPRGEWLHIGIMDGEYADGDREMRQVAVVSNENASGGGPFGDGGGVRLHLPRSHYDVCLANLCHLDKKWIFVK